MKILRIGLVIAFIAFVIIPHISTSPELNQDLGRHLAIGKIISETKQIPQVNLFSYTNPQFPFLNHHWLSEVIFYNLTQWTDLESLLVLKIICITTAILLVSFLAYKKSGLFAAITSGMVLSPLMVDRSYIRPELFGYIFFSFMLFVIFSYPKYKKLVWFFPFIMLLWVNLHISFVFGIFFILYFFMFYALPKGKQILSFTFPEKILLFTSLLVVFLNPYGIQGVLYPFSIFQNYGYEIAENQSIPYLSTLLFDPMVKYFLFLSPFFLITSLVLFIKSRFKETLFFVLFSILTLRQIRHMPFFVLAGIPLMAIAIQDSITLSINVWGKKKIKNIRILCSIAFIIGSILFAFLFISNAYYKTFDINKSFGIGLTEDAKGAAVFVKKNKLSPNIFNDFDIGGYLIYSLYPTYRMFVDNRPEAYPKQFFQTVYIKTQYDISVQNAVFNSYAINTIIFAHTDQTPWAKKFVQGIAKNSLWRLVYLDHTMVIFSKEKHLTDVRVKKQYGKMLIDNEKNYYNLLKLSQIFSLLGNKTEANMAFQKAYRINPASCAIIRTLDSQSPTFEKKQKNWWCF